MADSDYIDLSTLPPMGGAGGGGAPAAAAVPDYKRFKKGDKLPEGYSTTPPSGGAPAAAAPPAATPAPSAAAAPPPATTGTGAAVGAAAGKKVDEGVQQVGDWTSSLTNVVSGVIPESWKQKYQAVQEKYGKPAEQAYEKVAKPVTKAAAMGVEDWIVHPRWATAEGQKEIMRQVHTPYDQLPEYSRDIAEMVVPQTIPDAALMATPWVMPEIEAGRIVGEGGTIADRLVGKNLARTGRELLGNRLARVGAGGVVGGVTGGLTGQGALPGAVGGAAGFAIPEVAGKAISSVSRRVGGMGEGALRRETTENLGRELTRNYPWLTEQVPGKAAQAVESVTSLPKRAIQAIPLVGDRLSQTGVGRFADKTAAFGKAISDRLPWIGKLETASDFADTFTREGAVRRTGEEARRVRGVLNKFFGDRTFVVPVIGEDGEITAQHMTFDQADKLKTEYDRGGFALQGQRRSGIRPRQYQDVGQAIRDHLASQMDWSQGGFAGGGRLGPQELARLKSMGVDVSKGVGEAYKGALKPYDIAKELTTALGKKEGLYHPEFGLNQPELIDRLDKASHGLNRAMGPERTADLLNVIKRGYVGEGKDLFPKAKAHSWLKHIAGAGLGYAAGEAVGYPKIGSAIGGLWGFGVGGGGEGKIGPIDPAGNVRWSMRPQMDAAEALFSSKLRRWLAHPDNQRSNMAPAHDAANKSRAENVAGPTATPDRVSLIQDHTQQIARGDSPNVQSELNRGNLSIGNVRKMLDNSKSGTGIQTAFTGLSPQQAIEAFAQVDQGEKQALWPILAQHLQNSGKNMQPQERQQMLAQLQGVMGSGAA